MDNALWEQRLADVWASIDRYEDGAEFQQLVADLVSELPQESAIGEFELAASYDSTGYPDRALPLYRHALEVGLTGERRRRAVIQMASSLRNLGRADEAVSLLEPELQHSSDHLDDAVRAFLALSLADVGRPREGLSLALESLAPHLPRYQRAVGNYARQLTSAD